ncbi:MAG TPA: bifunctional isocitrate dehydrogenase kinase/phosphatase [Myxococcales bacterium]|jgi:isocitrate dehydrogenase kinase/phosphatase
MINIGPPPESAERRARIVVEAYDRFAEGFLAITRRARGRFERREWRELQADTRERLDLYQHLVEAALAELAQAGDGAEEPRKAWAQTKPLYCAMARARQDSELAETFYNSVVRRVLGTVGVDAETEFGDPTRTADGLIDRSFYRRYVPGGSLAAMLREVFADSLFTLRDPAADAARVAAEMERLLAERDAPPIERLDLLAEPFFRGQAAYLIGRVWTGEGFLPLVIALLNPPEGICADAVMMDAREVAGIFSLSRTYFFHAQPHPRATVKFLGPLLKRPEPELYTALGHKRHGKTELYRHLRSRLAETGESFVPAPGVAGLVMIVFTLPNLDLVFKVIRDKPGQPKDTSRAEVMERYRLVFAHDRVGRLLDAQEFEHLRFPRHRFSDELLGQLLREAGETVFLDGDTVVIGHAYTERKVVPLDLFLRSRDAAAVRAAVLDYGNAIKELAAVNIFPGDILLKNFGVKPDGRVVFYDYDELQLLTQVNFRAMPHTDDVYDEMSSEPWFYVGEHDVFPEEFPAFIALPEAQRAVFQAVHGDLFTIAFWQGVQERHRAGEQIRVLPYRKRLPPLGGPPVAEERAAIGAVAE